MNNTEQKLSIIIPTRIIDFLLKECISEIRKLYNAVKIIIIADEYNEDDIKAFDTNIIFMKSKNKNMSAKRNLGVQNTSCEYVAFIDSDAYPCPKWLEMAIDFLDKNSDYTAVTGNQILPQNDNFTKQCLRQVRFSKLFTYPQWGKVIDITAKEEDCTEFMTSNVILRKTDYFKLQGMNEQIYLAEDNEFSKRLINNGYKIRFIPRVCVFHHEAAFYPFMRKIFCMANYYTTEFINFKSKASISENIRMFLPLFGIFIMVLILLATICFKINSFVNLIIPSLIAAVFLKESFILSKKLPQKRFQGILLFLCCFISFCIFYIAGQICAILRIPLLNAQDGYKHY